MVSERTIGRLSQYRSFLSRLLREDATHVYSHQLAAYCGVTSSQVRRDMMAIHHSGSPSRGYGLVALLGDIGRVLDEPAGERVAVVGVGNLGRALMAYFAGRRPKMEIAAAFDSDPAKVGRLFHGCRCHPMDELERVMAEAGIRVAVIAVPGGEAQAVASRLVQAGARGLLNFAPVRLTVPEGVHVEYIDMVMALEKVAYFARGLGGRDGG